MPTTSAAVHGLYVPRKINPTTTTDASPLSSVSEINVTHWAQSSSIQLLSQPSTPSPSLKEQSFIKKDQDGKEEESCGKKFNRKCGCYCYLPLCCALLCLLSLVVGGIVAGVLVSQKQGSAQVTTASTTTTTNTTNTPSTSTTTTMTTIATASTTATTTTIATTSTPTTTTTIATASTTATTTTIATTSTPTTTVVTTTANVPSNVLNNTCTSIVSGSSTVLVYLSNATSFSYTYYQYSYVAASTTTLMMLALRQDPNFWCLDDITVVDPNGVQLWQNGGFEMSPLTTYYTYCNPNGASFSGTISSSCVNSGSYSFYDGSVGYSDYLSQSFTTVVGATYTIGFWLANQGGGPNSFLLIIG